MRPKNKNYVCFSDARNFVHTLKISGYEEWRKYRDSGNKPLFIPSDPYGVYRKDWISWGDWLGNGKVHGCLRKYVINDDFFKTWSHDMAYILGFWWADGFITSNQFSITQNKKDKYILEMFLKTMNSNYPIKFHFRNNVRFLIKSEKIVNDIKSIGGTEKKSKRIKFPSIPSEYLFSFIRGFFDGDGSVLIDNKRKGVSYVFCCNSKGFLEQIKTSIKNKIPSINGSIYKSVSKAGSRVCDNILKKDSVNYILKYYKKDCKKLFPFLYSDGEMFLKRKKEKYEKTL